MTIDVRHLGSMTREAVQGTAEEAVLVLPIGSTEQHGPAMPLITDTALVDAVLDAALTVLSSWTDLLRPIIVAPTLPYGNSQHHLFACAGSLTPTTLLAVLGDLITSYNAGGFQRLFVLNGHGGNHECIRIAIHDAVTRLPMLLGACTYATLAEVDAAGEAMARILVPGHAGTFEASLLLAVRPDLLNPASLRADLGARMPVGRPTYLEEIAPGVTVARAGDWANSGGFTDSPIDASAEIGNAHLKVLSERLADVLARFASMPLDLTS